MGDDDETVWLTVREAARLAGVDGDTIRRWTHQGRVRHHRTAGGHRRIDRGALLAVISPVQERRTDARYRSPADAIGALGSEFDHWWGWRPSRSESDDELTELLVTIGAGGVGGGLIAALEELASVVRSELRSRDLAADA